MTRPRRDFTDPPDFDVKLTRHLDEPEVKDGELVPARAVHLAGQTRKRLCEISKLSQTSPQAGRMLQETERELARWPELNYLLNLPSPAAVASKIATQRKALARVAELMQFDLIRDDPLGLPDSWRFAQEAKIFWRAIAKYDDYLAAHEQRLKSCESRGRPRQLALEALAYRLAIVYNRHRTRGEGDEKFQIAGNDNSGADLFAATALLGARRITEAQAARRAAIRRWIRRQHNLQEEEEEKKKTKSGSL